MTDTVEPQLQYSLVIVQQPKRAKAYEINNRERRPIDPCPILQLQVNNPDGTENTNLHWNGEFVVHALLFDESGTREISYVSDNFNFADASSHTIIDEGHNTMLVGLTVSSVYYLRDLEEICRCFFYFSDIQVRQPGRFRLRFGLLRLNTEDMNPIESKTVLKYVFSDPFTVYTSKDFPGVDESTALSKKLNQQGLGIPIRNKGRLKRDDDEDGEGDVCGVGSSCGGNNDYQWS
ncbi:hypothetical protein LPJ66_001004 [Kickxella alabastrina]|uniref:Uncharacterized protein n=1 Tax=Kickxella alabastrina TaxID=61397 RepID=A0ACC1IUI5_9FUNG|nr:hypothetical protein LPJ66_001004 [Kickxella alabastrina]